MSSFAFDQDESKIFRKTVKTIFVFCFLFFPQKNINSFMLKTCEVKTARVPESNGLSLYLTPTGLYSQKLLWVLFCVCTMKQRACDCSQCSVYILDSPGYSLVSLRACVCMYYVCTYACARLCICVCVAHMWKPEVSIRCLSQSFSVVRGFRSCLLSVLPLGPTVV